MKICKHSKLQIAANLLAEYLVTDYQLTRGAIFESTNLHRIHYFSHTTEERKDWASNPRESILASNLLAARNIK